MFVARIGVIIEILVLSTTICLIYTVLANITQKLRHEYHQTGKNASPPLGCCGQQELHPLVTESMHASRTRPPAGPQINVKLGLCLGVDPFLDLVPFFQAIMIDIDMGVLDCIDQCTVIQKLLSANCFAHEGANRDDIFI